MTLAVDPRPDRGLNVLAAVATVLVIAMSAVAVAQLLRRSDPPRRSYYQDWRDGPLSPPVAVTLDVAGFEVDDVVTSLTSPLGAEVRSVLTWFRSIGGEPQAIKRISAHWTSTVTVVDFYGISVPACTAALRAASAHGRIIIVAASGDAKDERPVPVAEATAADDCAPARGFVRFVVAAPK